MRASRSEKSAPILRPARYTLTVEIRMKTMSLLEMAQKKA